jgi:DNA-binding Lrp family transcriptional regulator
MKPLDRNGFLPLSLPTQKSLRGAVATIIRDVQRDYGETDQETADQLGISDGTVRNARNERADLNAVTIARIGARYGAHYVDPYHRLYGARAENLDRKASDPLTPLAEAVATICKMRCPNGPGGIVELPKERLDALPMLKEAYRELGAYISEIEALRVSA